MTLRQALLERPNSLNLVRLVLAVSVVLGHAWPVGNAGEVPPWAQPFATLPVPAFFCLSGFLIAHSRMHLPLGRFMWHRTLRIAPGLWVVLVVTAFVAAPLSVLAGGSWGPSTAIDYVLANALLPHQGSMPGTVGDAAWNGSLWTLLFEFVAYVFVGLFLSVAPLRRHFELSTVATYAVVVTLVCSAVGAVGGDAMVLGGVPGLHAIACFLGGMVVYAFSDRILVDTRLAAVALVGVVVLWSSGHLVALGALPLAYVVLWLGSVIPARWASRYDISYGVYVYAFPVQVLLEWFSPGLPVATHVVAALAITCPLALASWVLVERPAMRLRHLAIGRRPPALGCAEEPRHPRRVTGPVAGAA